jgi:peptidyl-prolyl cis-trans isomerase C
MSVTARVFLIAAIASTAANAQTGQKILAVVNGASITESRVTEQYEQLSADDTKGREADVKIQLLDRVIDQELVAQEAIRLNIETDPDYQKQLRLVKLQLQANAVVARKVSDALTDTALRQHYNSTKQNLAFPAVKAKHILVPTEAEARQIIKIVSPPTFSDLAKTRSKGPSADQGGELGWFRKEAMIPEFAEIAFSIPVGTIATKPIKTQFGWHVLYVEERNLKYIPPFKDVEPQIRQEMAAGVVATYLQDLRKKANIIMK